MYSGHIFRQLLVTLYNSMLLKSYIPESMKIGIFITLYKGGGKRKDETTPTAIELLRLPLLF